MKIDTTWKKLLIIFVLVKVVIFCFIYASPFIIDYAYLIESNNLHYPMSFSYGNVLRTWDAQHYLYLTEFWYVPGHINTAFYPLFPILSFIVRPFVLGSSLIAGLLVSNVASVFALYLFYKLTKKLFNKDIAFHAALFFILFPTSFYLSLIYSESIFLLLTLGSFVLLYGGRYIWSSFLSLLLPLTRPQGLLVAAPLLFHSVRNNDKRLNRHLLFVLFPLAGFGLYLLILYLSLGDAFAGFQAQGYFRSENSILHLFQPIEWIKRNITEISWNFTTVLDRLFFMSFIWGLVEVYKKLDKTLFVYTLTIGGVTTLSGNLMSFPRYMLMFFPIFIAMALCIKKPMTRYVIWFAFGFSQVILLLLHTNHYWVS